MQKAELEAERAPSKRSPVFVAYCSIITDAVRTEHF